MVLYIIGNASNVDFIDAVILYFKKFIWVIFALIVDRTAEERQETWARERMTCSSRSDSNLFHCGKDFCIHALFENALFLDLCS